jgi:hypothetical protein
MGWLESNVVRFTDPAHYLYDRTGKTFHIFMRSYTELPNYACIVQARENDDGTISTMPVLSPAGRKMVFAPMPGGHNKFYILKDSRTDLYWLASSQSTNGMLRKDMLPAGQHDIFNERYRLALYFSKTCFDWCFAGMAAQGETPVCSRHYAAMDIDGDDLVLVSRSGDKDAKSPHDTNMATFHRIKDFRKLAY